MRKILALLLVTVSLTGAQSKDYRQTRQNCYCEYCGRKYQDVRQLTSEVCPKHPDGFNKGRHKLYEGSEKPQYTCKYCGHTYRTIREMVINPCPRHPKGFNKGKHAPAL